MKFNQIFLLFCVLYFYHLSNEFANLGEMNYQLLKMIIELIFLLFVMILYKYKEEIKKAIYFEKCQRKIDEFLSKEGK